MKYTVIWRPDAEDELAELWLAGPDRTEIAQAADQIDVVLGQNPLTAGESRGGGERVFFERPLGVVYRVSQDDRTVVVWAVWRIR
jgi:plasmid stabilization system protein ParE